MNSPPALSIIIPFFNEESCVDPVIREIQRCHPDAEIIAVDDCSTDGTAAALGRQSDIRVHRLNRHLGQSAALYAGLELSCGEICVIMDGDGQSNAGEIKRLLAHIPAYDLVIGRRTHRQDNALRIVVSRLANGLRRRVLGDGVFDTGGTPKVLKRSCVDQLVAFDGLHRFLPSLLTHAGFRVLEVPVDHRPRHGGQSKYGSLRRGLRGVVDLIGVGWLRSRLIDPRDLGLDLPPDDEQISERRIGEEQRLL